MNTIKNISASEHKKLLKFPAYISLLAANSDSSLDEVEKRSAIKFSHIKTYSCDPLLASFYEAADKDFEMNIQQLNKNLPLGKQERDIAIKKELMDLEKIIIRFGKDYAEAMHRSMKSFKEHVSKAHHNVFVDFIFPLPIKGLTD